MGYPVETMLDFNELRSRLGTTGVTVLVMGGLTLPPENYGPFYWKADSIAPDDNRDVIQCSGIPVGRYLRAFTSGGIGGAGSFYYDTSFSLVVTNQVYIVPQNVTKYIKGRLIKTDQTKTTFDGIGMAKIAVQANVIKGKGKGNGIFDIWLRKNGTDIPDTRRSYFVLDNSGYLVEFEEEFDVIKGDYIEVVIQGSDNAFQLQKSIQIGIPDVPAFKLNVNLINPIVI